MSSSSSNNKENISLPSSRTRSKIGQVVIQDNGFPDVNTQSQSNQIFRKPTTRKTPLSEASTSQVNLKENASSQSKRGKISTRHALQTRSQQVQNEISSLLRNDSPIPNSQPLGVPSLLDPSVISSVVSDNVDFETIDIDQITNIDADSDSQLAELPSSSSFWNEMSEVEPSGDDKFDIIDVGIVSKNSKTKSSPTKVSTASSRSNKIISSQQVVQLPRNQLAKSSQPFGPRAVNLKTPSSSIEHGSLSMLRQSRSSEMNSSQQQIPSPFTSTSPATAQSVRQLKQFISRLAQQNRSVVVQNTRLEQEARVLRRRCEQLRIADGARGSYIKVLLNQCRNVAPIASISELPQQRNDELKTTANESYRRADAHAQTILKVARYEERIELQDAELGNLRAQIAQLEIQASQHNLGDTSPCLSAMSEQSSSPGWDSDELEELTAFFPHKAPFVPLRPDDFPVSHVHNLPSDPSEKLKCQEYESRIQELEQQLVNRQSQQQQLESLQATIDNLQQSLSSSHSLLEEEQHNLRLHQDAATSQLHAVRSELLKAQAMCTTLETQKESYQKQIQLEIERNVRINAQLSDTQDKIAQYKQETHEAQINLTDMTMQVTWLRDDKARLEQELDAIRTCCFAVFAQLTLVLRSFATSFDVHDTDAHETLMQVANNLHNMFNQRLVDDVSPSINQIKSKPNSSSTSNDNETSASDLSNSLEHYSRSLVVLQDNIAQYLSRIQELSSQSQQKKSAERLETEALQKELAQLKIDFFSEQQQYHLACQHEKNSNELLNQKLAISEQQLAQLKHSTTIAANQALSYNQQLEERKNAYKQRYVTTHSKYTSLFQLYEECQATMRHNYATLNRWQQHVSQLEVQISQLMKENSQLNDQRDKQTQKEARYKAALETCRTVLFQYNSMLYESARFDTPQDQSASTDDLSRGQSPFPPQSRSVSISLEDMHVHKADNSQEWDQNDHSTFLPRQWDVSSSESD